MLKALLYLDILILSFWIACTCERKLKANARPERNLFYFALVLIMAIPTVYCGWQLLWMYAEWAAALKGKWAAEALVQ